jgi:hypothetical protein
MASPTTYKRRYLYIFKREIEEEGMIIHDTQLIISPILDHLTSYEVAFHEELTSGINVKAKLNLLKVHILGGNSDNINPQSILRTCDGTIFQITQNFNPNAKYSISPMGLNEELKKFSSILLDVWNEVTKHSSV